MFCLTNKLSQTQNGRKFILSVAYQKDFDMAIALELLKKLGLNRPGLLDLFNRTYFNGNFVLFCTNQIRNQQGLFANQAKLAKTLGQVTIPIIVDYSLLQQIADFFKDVVDQIAKRIAESGERFILSDIYTTYGIGKDIQESGGDIIQGLKDIVGGFWDGNISTVGSQKFQEGWNRFFGGIGKTGIGYFKLGFQMPLDAFATKAVNLLSAFQTLIGIESLGRLLTLSEINLLKTVFGASLVYEAIRIKSGYAGDSTSETTMDLL